MIKMYGLLPRRSDVTEEFFQDHWRTVHGPMVEFVPSIHRYIQSHRRALPADGFAENPYTGVAEVWFDDLDAVIAFASDPGYLENAVPDEPNFIDVERQRMLPAAEVDRWGEIGDGDATKLICLLTQTGAGDRGGLADAIPTARALAETIGATGVVRHVAIDGFPGTEPAFDFVVEVYLPSLQAASAAARTVADRCLATDVFDGPASIALVAQEVRIR
jgi:uncharacterized protein (TIGR02118 family)